MSDSENPRTPVAPKAAEPPKETPTTLTLTVHNPFFDSTNPWGQDSPSGLPTTIEYPLAKTLTMTPRVPQGRKPVRGDAKNETKDLSSEGKGDVNDIDYENIFENPVERD